MIDFDLWWTEEESLGMLRAGVKRTHLTEAYYNFFFVFAIKNGVRCGKLGVFNLKISTSTDRI